MYLEKKLEEADSMHREIKNLLLAMPDEDSRPIDDELNLWNIYDELDEASSTMRHLSIKVDELHRQLFTTHKEMLTRLTVQRLLERDRSYIPVLAPLMNMIPEDEDHTDIVWIRKWITHPENSLDEATYFCIHAVKAAAEALVIICPVVKDQWEQLVWDLIPNFEVLIKRWQRNDRYDIDFGLVSKRFNLWIVCVVGDPVICPNSNLRLRMLLLYKILKIDNENYEEALNAVFSAFSPLIKHRDSIVGVSTKALEDCLRLFDEPRRFNKLYNFGSRLAERLRQNKNTRKQILIHDISCEYAMGLKIVVEPREIVGLSAYLKYISGRTDIQYKDFQEDPNNVSHIGEIDESLRSLNYIIRNFQEVLEAPEMLSVIAECVMNVTQNAIRIKYFQIQNRILDSDALYNFNTIFTNIACLGLIEREIISTYKERICKWRVEIPKVFMDKEANSTLYNIIYNDEY